MSFSQYILFLLSHSIWSHEHYLCLVVYQQGNEPGPGPGIWASDAGCRCRQRWELWNLPWSVTDPEFKSWWGPEGWPGQYSCLTSSEKSHDCFIFRGCTSSCVRELCLWGSELPPRAKPSLCQWEVNFADTISISTLDESWWRHLTVSVGHHFDYLLALPHSKSRCRVEVLRGDCVGRKSLSSAVTRTLYLPTVDSNWGLCHSYKAHKLETTGPGLKDGLSQAGFSVWFSSNSLFFPNFADSDSCGLLVLSYTLIFR
jgi:hypothetical protein